jgi:hypothetical protein
MGDQPAFGERGQRPGCVKSVRSSDSYCPARPVAYGTDESLPRAALYTFTACFFGNVDNRSRRAFAASSGPLDS